MQDLILINHIQTRAVYATETIAISGIDTATGRPVAGEQPHR